MAVNFPQNPSEGDTFTSGNSSFTFSNGRWVSSTSPNSLVSKTGDTMTGLLTLSGDPVSDSQAATKLYVDTTSTRIIGEIIAFGGATIPSGWLECNGQSAPSALAAVLGTANVPDLRGEFIRGWDNGRGVDTGRALGSTQSHQFEDHKHTYNYWNQGSFGPANAAQRADTARNGLTTNKASSGNRGDETRPRNIALMYIIKT